MGLSRWGDRLILHDIFWSISIIGPHRYLERKLGYRRGLGCYGLEERLLVSYCLAVFDRSAWAEIMSSLLDIE